MFISDNFVRDVTQYFSLGIFNLATTPIINVTLNNRGIEASFFAGGIPFPSPNTESIGAFCRTTSTIELFKPEQLFYMAVTEMLWLFVFPRSQLMGNWNFRSLELSLPRAKMMWNFRSHCAKFVFLAATCALLRPIGL